MIDSYASIIVMLFFVILVYVFTQYLKEKFASKIGLEKEFDLFYIFIGIITVLFASVFLIQETSTAKTNVFTAFFSFVCVSILPFVLIMVVVFFKRALHIWTRKSEDLDYENKDNPNTQRIR